MSWITPDVPATEQRPAGPARAELPAGTVERFRDQDAEALAEVYDRYHRAVWSVAMSVTHDDHLAQEAVQDTFIRAWQAAGTFELGRPLGPWLLTIARRSALDLIRRELRPTRGGHEAEQDVVVEAVGMDEIWLAWQIQEALRQLTQDERRVVRLAFFEGLTQPEIAQRLAVPLGTVKSRSHRAHRRLAELLAYVRDDVGDRGGMDGGDVGTSPEVPNAPPPNLTPPIRPPNLTPPVSPTVSPTVSPASQNVSPNRSAPSESMQGMAADPGGTGLPDPEGGERRE